MLVFDCNIKDKEGKISRERLYVDTYDRIDKYYLKCYVDKIKENLASERVTINSIEIIEENLTRQDIVNMSNEVKHTYISCFDCTWRLAGIKTYNDDYFETKKRASKLNEEIEQEYFKKLKSMKKEDVLNDKTISDNVKQKVLGSSYPFTFKENAEKVENPERVENRRSRIL